MLLREAGAAQSDMPERACSIDFQDAQSTPRRARRPVRTREPPVILPACPSPPDCSHMQKKHATQRCSRAAAFQLLQEAPQDADEGRQRRVEEKMQMRERRAQRFIKTFFIAFLFFFFFHYHVAAYALLLAMPAARYLFCCCAIHYAMRVPHPHACLRQMRYPPSRRDAFDSATRARCTTTDTQKDAYSQHHLCFTRAILIFISTVFDHILSITFQSLASSSVHFALLPPALPPFITLTAHFLPAEFTSYFTGFYLILVIHFICLDICHLMPMPC